MIMNFIQICKKTNKKEDIRNEIPGNCINVDWLLCTS